MFRDFLLKDCMDLWLTLFSFTKLDEEKEKNAGKELEFDEEDEFVKMYHMKRLQEMRRRAEEYVASIR